MSSVHALQELTALTKRWATQREDLSQWTIRCSQAPSEDFALLRTWQLTGVVSQISFSWQGSLLFDVPVGPEMDMENTQVLLERLNPECSSVLLEICEKIADVVVLNKTPERLGLRLSEFCAACVEAGVQVEVTATILKSLPSMQEADIGRTSYFISEESFLAWLNTLSLVDAMSFIGSLPPPIVVVGEHREGAPDWIVTTEDFLGGIDRLRTLALQLSARQEQRLAELTARTTGPIIVREAFLGAAPEWIHQSPPFAVMLGFGVATILASEYQLNDNRLALVFRFRDRVTTHSLELRPLWMIENGEKYLPSVDDVHAWLDFLDYYHRMCDEARRDALVWQSALERSKFQSISSMIGHVGKLKDTFRTLRESLLDENLDKALTTSEKAETLVGQVASQIHKDIDAIGSDAERLAVASITSGLVGIVGAVFKSDHIAAIGPVATALTFLWYFPLMFGRLAYLEGSISRRSNDLKHALGSFRRSAGDVINEEEYLGRFSPHQQAAKDALSEVERHLRIIFLLLNIVAAAVTMYIVIAGQVDWPTIIAVVSILVSPAGVLFNNRFPTWIKMLLVATSLAVLVCLLRKVSCF